MVPHMEWHAISRLVDLISATKHMDAYVPLNPVEIDVSQFKSAKQLYKHMLKNKSDTYVFNGALSQNTAGEQIHSQLAINLICGAVAVFKEDVAANGIVRVYIKGVKPNTDCKKVMKHFSDVSGGVQKDPTRVKFKSPISDITNLLVPDGQIMNEYLLVIHGKDGTDPAYVEFRFMSGNLSNFAKLNKPVSLNELFAGTEWDEILEDRQVKISNMEQLIQILKVLYAYKERRTGIFDINRARGALTRIRDKAVPPIEGEKPSKNYTILYDFIGEFNRIIQIADDALYKVEASKLLFDIMTAVDGDGVATVSASLAKACGQAACLNSKVFNHMDGKLEVDFDQPLRGITPENIEELAGSSLAMAVMLMCRIRDTDYAMSYFLEMCHRHSFVIIENATHDDGAFVDFGWGEGLSVRYADKVDTILPAKGQKVYSHFNKGCTLALCAEFHPTTFTNIYSKELHNAVDEYIGTERFETFALKKVYECYSKGFRQV